MCNLPCMALMMKLSRDIFLKFTAINIMTFIFYAGKVADTVNTLLDGILVHCRLALRPSPGHLPSPPPASKGILGETPTLHHGEVGATQSCK